MTDTTVISTPASTTAPVSVQDLITALTAALKSFSPTAPGPSAGVISDAEAVLAKLKAEAGVIETGASGVVSSVLTGTSTFDVVARYAFGALAVFGGVSVVYLALHVFKVL